MQGAVPISGQPRMDFSIEQPILKSFEFELNLSDQKYLDYYRGSVRQVLVQCTNGVTIEFPASLLTKFVTDTGVNGHFVLTCDDEHKGSELSRWPPTNQNHQER